MNGNLRGHVERLEERGDRSGGAQLLRELAEAGPSGGGEVEACPHGLKQHSGAGRRQATHVGKLFLIQDRADDVTSRIALVRRLQTRDRKESKFYIQTTRAQEE